MAFTFFLLPHALLGNPIFTALFPRLSSHAARDDRHRFGLVLGLIKTLISFQGTLSSWWARIVIGLLLFAFILLQRLAFVRRR